MLEQIYRATDIGKRYGCSLSTARRYMREMEHGEKPLTVTESAVKRWDDSRTVSPVSVVSRSSGADPYRRKPDGHLVPRFRP